MEIILGKSAGFCYGVKRAINGAIEESKKHKELYCLGEIVHNKNVVNELKNYGIKFIETIEEGKNVVIVRAHGITKETYKKAKDYNIQLKDLTCPNVLKVHEIIEEYDKKGYFIILVGQKEHPEVIGTASFCSNEIMIIKDESEINQLIERVNKLKINNVLITSQTTFDIKKFNIIVQKIKEKLPTKNIIVKNTICPATKIRQDETEKISKHVDTMIIIGDKKSSNTNKLYNIASTYCKNVFFVQGKDEINIETLKDKAKIGVMAGASTPDEDIKEILKFIERGE